MHSTQTASATGRRPLRSEDPSPRSELARLRATCRRQAIVIDRLSEALSTFRLGAQALKDQNAELRTEIARLHAANRLASPADHPRDEDQPAGPASPAGPRAPDGALGGSTPSRAHPSASSLLERARLLVRAGHDQRAPQWRTGRSP